MNQEIKQMWIDALLSGEYQQGKDVLHNLKDNTFCCLGVLCDIAVKNKKLSIVEESELYTYYGCDNEKTELELPVCVMEWAEISDSAGKYKEGNLSLAELNDRGRSFKYIVNVIKKYF